MSPLSADRNLLFGIIALQMDFITRDQLIAGMHAWVLEKDKPLGDVLVALGHLSSARRGLLRPLVDEHLRQHGDDARASLGALPGAGSIRHSLESIADDDLQRSLHSLPRSGENGAPPSDDDPPPAEGSTASWDGDVLTLTSRYRVVRGHASGGIGDVSLATDESLDRRIAIKKIQERWLKSKKYDEFRARFLVEAEITGGLDHPFIVPIHGLGFDGSKRPFYAMRFIDGQTLKSAVDEFHQSLKHRRAVGQERVAFLEFLTRFIQVCQAAHYAHERGVIHRDITPGNIMLGKHGETLLVDWGLAKVVGRAESAVTDGEPSLHPSSGSEVTPTEAGDVKGTLGYMPPEQAEGRLDAIDRRSDVYALGATLYYMLTGRPQVDDVNPVDKIRRITAGAITPPRQAKLAPSAKVKLDVPKPLEAICRKAMSVPPGDRYATAADLADDIKRFLASEPVSAYRENLSERTRRWSRKHRTLVTTATALLVASLLGVSAFASVLNSKNRALSKANVEITAQRTRAEAREQQAIDAVKRFGDVVSKNPELKDNPELKGLRETLLKEPLAFFKSLRDQMQATPDTRPAALVRLASATFSLATLTEEIGDQEDALRAYGESLAIFERMVREHPTVSAYQSDLAANHTNIGILQAATGRSADALDSFGKALAIRERLAREHPTVTAYQADLALSHNNIGARQSETGRPANALDSFGKALAILERLAREHPTVTAYQRDLALSHHNIGNFQRETGRPADALESHGKALAIQERLAREHPAVTAHQNELARSHNHIGALQSETGRPAAALESYVKALAIRERLARDHPTVTAYESDLAESHNNRGNLQRETGRLADALESFGKAVAIQTRLARENPTVTEFQSNLAMSHNNIGNLQRATGRLADALESHRKALAIRERLAWEHPTVTAYQSDLAASHHNMGNHQQTTARPADALESYGKALAIQTRLARENPTVTEFQSGLAASHNNIGILQYKTGRPGDALESFGNALAIRARLVREQPSVATYQRDLAMSHNDIGILQHATGRPPDALDSHGKALAIRERLARENPASPDFASDLGATLHNMAMIDLDQRRPVQPRSKLKRAINEQKRALAANPKNPTYRQLLANHLTKLIKAAQALGNDDEAAAARKELDELKAGTWTLEKFPAAKN